MKKLATLSIIALSFIACNSDDNSALDQEAPTVNITAPTDHQEYEPGETLTVQALLADNVSLASFKIEIHSAEDGHTHSVNALTAEDEHVEFHYEADYDIEGLTYEVNEDIAIPAETEEGHYHVGIFVLDTAGNQSEQFVEVYIGHEDHTH